VSENQKPPEFKDLLPAPATLAQNTTIISVEQHQHVLEAFTRVTEDNARLKEDLANLRITHDTETILNKLIVPYARRAFIFMCVYCSAVFILLVVGLVGYALPEKVLEILVGSTAAAVVGLVGMVLTGIFVGARRK
jgi:hypothetical protein